MWWVISLTVFNILFLMVDVSLFVFILLLKACWASRKFIFMSFIIFGKLSAIISSEILYSCFSFSFPSGISKMCTFVCWMVYQRLLDSIHFSSIFFILFLRFNNFNSLIFNFMYYFFRVFKSAFDSFSWFFISVAILFSSRLLKFSFKIHVFSLIFSFLLYIIFLTFSMYSCRLLSIF